MKSGGALATLLVAPWAHVPHAEGELRTAARGFRCFDRGL